MNTVQDSQLEFDLGDNEVATDVAVIDAPVEKDDKPVPVESERHRSELEAVNDSVQKRISKLTARMRESERREQAAVEYARGLQSQTNELQQKLVHTDYSRLSETKTRLEGQQATLKNIIRKAREEGDIDTETEAQQRLAEMGMEQRFNLKAKISNNSSVNSSSSHGPNKHPRPSLLQAPRQRIGRSEILGLGRIE